MKVTLAQLARMRRQCEGDLVAGGMPADQAKRVAWDLFAVYDLVTVDDQGREWVDVPDDDPPEPKNGTTGKGD
jgi:hypothetical protein